MSTRKFGGRTLARSQALQLLFQAEATERSVDEILAGPYALSQGPLDEYGERLARGAGRICDRLDAVIGGASTNWSVQRMPSVDRNLLRLALYEMLEVDEVAVAVTIDESVELAKAYGTDESSRFVNGLLGRIAADIDHARAVVDGEVENSEVEGEAVAKTDEGASEELAEPEAAADVAGVSGYDAGLADDDVVVVVEV